MKKKLLLTLALVGYLSFSFGQSCPLGLSGTFTIGPTGHFPTIQTAMNALYDQGLSGPVILELQATYHSSVESFPLTLVSAPCASKENGITIRPAANAPPLSISSNDSLATIVLNHASYITLDGRAEGTGNGNGLSVSNTHIKGSALLLMKGSVYNEIKYVDMQGVSGYTGVITIGHIYDSLGNNYNGIDSCSISAGATVPLNGVYATGGVPSNKGNRINGCRIFNFGGDWPSIASGIELLSGNDSTSITGNSVYRTSDHDTYLNPLSFPVTLYGIQVATPYNGGNIVSGNYIGGTAPLAGGSPMELYDCGTFFGISVCNYTGAAMASQVTDNMVTNINESLTYGSYTMIQLGGVGAFHGLCANNIIGNSSGARSVTVWFPGAHGDNFPSLVGILLQGETGYDRVTISGNQVAFSAAPGTSTFADIMEGIKIFGFNSCNCTVSGNTIGDSTYSNLLSPQCTGVVKGIDLLGGSQLRDSSLIQNNTVINLRSGAGAIGIEYSGFVNGVIRISGNRIHDLYAAGEATIYPCVAGINIPVNDVTTTYGSNGSLTCDGNTITQLGFGNGLTYPTSNEDVEGIYASANSLSHNFHYVISRNLIEDLGLTNSAYPSDFVTTTITGLTVQTTNTGASVIDNNMIRLGLDIAGVPITNSYSVTGIYDAGGNNSYLHNTVYVQQEAANPAVAYGSCLSLYPDTSSLRVVMNNIFDCRRDTTAGTIIGAIELPINSNPPAGIRMDYNLYHVEGKSAYLAGGGNLTTMDRTTSSLLEWQTATGMDQHSLSADPLFIHPAGSLNELNLHVAYGSPIESAGTAAYTTLTDFDGEIRANLTPVDIGADAGIFSAIVPPPPPPPVLPPTAPVDSSTRDTSSFVVAYPNPFTSILHVQVKAPQTGTVRIAIYNLSGLMVLLIQFPVMQGTNVVAIPTDGLAAGTYVVKADEGGQSGSILVMKR